MNRKIMNYIFGSKLVAGVGLSTALAIGLDKHFLDETLAGLLNINPFFTNSYLFLFVVYYAIKIYWFWIDKALNKKEREKQLKE